MTAVVTRRALATVLAIFTLGSVDTFAVTVGIEGTDDPEAQVIAKGVEAYFADLESVGRVTVAGEGLVKPGEDGGYLLRLPRFAIHTEDGGKIDLSFIHADVTPLGDGRYAFDMRPTLPMEIWSPDEMLVAVIPKEQSYRGIWDAAFNTVAQGTFEFRDISLIGPGLRGRIDEVRGEERRELGFDGTTVDHRTSGEMRGFSLTLKPAEFSLSVERASFASTGNDVPLAMLRASLVLNLNGSPGGDIGPEALFSLLRMGGESGRLDVEMTAEELILRDSDWSLHVDRLLLRQRLGDGAVYAGTLEGVHAEDVLDGRLYSFRTLEMQSRGEINDTDSFAGSQIVAFEGFQFDIAPSQFLPARGRLVLGLKQVSLSHLTSALESVDLSGPSEAVVAPVFGALAESGAVVSIDAFDLRGMGARALLEAPIGFDIQTMRPSTEPNRLVVHGLSGLVTGLAAEGADPQLVGGLAAALAMGRAEQRGGETVHIFDLAIDESGAPTVNGRPIGGAP